MMEVQFVSLNGLLSDYFADRTDVEVGWFNRKKRHNYPDHRQPVPGVVSRIEERGKYFLELYQGGMTLDEIGKKEGLSRERVRQILEKTGKYKRRIMKRLSKEEKAHERIKKSIDKFWASVDNSLGAFDCWPWTRSTYKKGYGHVTMKAIPDGKNYAHRIAYILSFGDIPDGMEVCHSCNNPICCNPSHLYAGTHKQNMVDREERYKRGDFIRSKRGKKPQTERNTNIVKEYNGGVSIKGLAIMFRLNIDTVYSILNKNGIYQAPRYRKIKCLETLS